MAFSIRSKLYGLATLAVAAILVTAVGAAWALTRVGDEIAAAAPRIVALEAIAAARSDVLETVLAAMDASVERDEGAGALGQALMVGHGRAHGLGVFQRRDGRQQVASRRAAQTRRGR